MNKGSGDSIVDFQDQAAALTCFATGLAIRIPEKILVEALDDLEEVSPRFRSIVDAILTESIRQIEIAAKMLDVEGLDASRPDDEGGV